MFDRIGTALTKGAIGLGLSALAFGATVFATGDVAEAQSPPAPPSRFVGTVIVDGQPATAGTAIVAKVGNATCGTAGVFMNGSEARYQVDVAASEPTNNPQCGTDGATVTFFVGDRQANQTGSWANYQLNVLNLTVGSQTTPTTTATSTSTATTTPTGTTTSTPVATTPSGGSTSTATAPASTPRAPVTGSGTAGGGDASWLLMAGGLIALLAGTTGVVAARKRR